MIKCRYAIASKNDIPLTNDTQAFSGIPLMTRAGMWISPPETSLCPQCRLESLWRWRNHWTWDFPQYCLHSRQNLFRYRKDSLQVFWKWNTLIISLELLSTYIIILLLQTIVILLRSGPSCGPLRSPCGFPGPPSCSSPCWLWPPRWSRSNLIRVHSPPHSRRLN